MHTDGEQLAGDIERVLSTRFQEAPLISSLRTGFGLTTKAVKTHLGSLGRARGFKVAGSGLVDADQGEWLYDMVWYELDERGYMKRQILVLECELNPAPEIDDDFQKLVQARADVRVWISCSPNQQMQQSLLVNCKRQAELFTSALTGDAYIFVTDNWTNPKTSVERFVVNRGGSR